VDLGALDRAVIILYVAGMLAVGFFVTRRITGFRDFFVAGGRLTTPVLVCTLVSTYYGLDVTFGSSETAYFEGMAAFFAYSAPFYVAYVATALLVAPRVRKLPAMSLPEAMGIFYGRPARLAGAVASFVYSAPILAVVGMGLIGKVCFGWPVETGCIAGAAVALAYTVLGGLWADALTDAFQFVIMCVTLAVAAAAAMTNIGTPAALGERLPAEVLSPFGELSAGEILVFAGVALTPLVEPAFYQRTFAANSSREIVRALLIGVALWMAYDWLVVYLGIAGRDLVASGAIPADVKGKEVLLHVVAHLLPAGLLGSSRAASPRPCPRWTPTR
jgi:SSS family solute:Na+ symporter